MEDFGNNLDIVALVGAATACQGVALSYHIACFLVRLTCGLSAEIPETNTSVTIPTFFGDWPRLLAASSLGTMLYVDNGGIFWRQCIAHIIIPNILKACVGSVVHDSDLLQITLSAPPLGPLAAA